MFIVSAHAKTPKIATLANRQSENNQKLGHAQKGQSEKWQLRGIVSLEGRRPSKKKGEGGPEVAVMPPITFSTGQADHKHPPLKFTVIVTALLTLHSLANFGK